MPDDKKPEGEPLALSCSFCGKPQHRVQKPIAGLALPIPGVRGPPACICDECVDVCAEIVAEGK